EPLEGYYPRAVTPEEFAAARAGAEQRKKKPGRLGSHVNVFSGLLHCASDGGTYYASASYVSGAPGEGGPLMRSLKNSEAANGRAPWRTFPFGAFESAVLSCLREIDPHEILNGDSGPDESLVLAGELARVETKIGELEAELLKGDVTAVVKVLRKL